MVTGVEARARTAASIRSARGDAAGNRRRGARRGGRSNRAERGLAVEIGSARFEGRDMLGGDDLDLLSDESSAPFDHRDAALPRNLGAQPRALILLLLLVCRRWHRIHGSLEGVRPTRASCAGAEGARTQGTGQEEESGADLTHVVSDLWESADARRFIRASPRSITPPTRFACAQSAA